MKAKIAADKYESDGRLNTVNIEIGSRKLKAQYVYSPDKLLRQINFDGKQSDLPSVPELLSLFDGRFKDYIGVIDIISLIRKILQIVQIDNITNIGNIESAKLYTQRQTELGNEVDYLDLDVVGSGVLTQILDYAVPVGKLFYLYDWSVGLLDGDGQLFGELTDDTTGADLAVNGGTRGFSIAFTKPKKLIGNHHVAVWIRQDTGGARTAYSSISGLLV